MGLHSPKQGRQQKGDAARTGPSANTWEKERRTGAKNRAVRKNVREGGRVWKTEPSEKTWEEDGLEKTCETLGFLDWTGHLRNLSKCQSLRISQSFELNIAIFSPHGTGHVPSLRFWTLPGEHFLVKKLSSHKLFVDKFLQKKSKT